MQTALLSSAQAGPGVAAISATAAGAGASQRETDSGLASLRAPSAGRPGVLRHQYKYLSIIILLKDTS